MRNGLAVAVTAATLIEPPVAEHEPEALIEEARARQRRRRLWIAAVLLAAAALGLGLYAAFGGGGLFGLGGSDGGGGAPSAVYHKGWIYHEVRELTLVPYPGAGHYDRLVTERWVQTVPPFRTRELTYGAYWTEKRVEVTRSAHESGAYDPQTKTLYATNRAPAAKFTDPAASARAAIRSGRWKVAKRLTLDGREVLRIDNAVPGFHYYVDAHTFLVVRIEGQGFPLHQRGGKRMRPPCTYEKGPTTPASRSVDQLQVSEYLPPTKRNLKLLDAAAQHPGMKTAPASATPKRFKAIVDPPSCGQLQP